MIVLWKGSDQIFFFFFFGPLFSFLAGVLVTWAEHVTVSHFLIKFFLRRRHLSLRNSTRLSHKSKECTVNCDSTLPANASKSDDMSIFLLILFSSVKTVGLQPALVICSVFAFVFVAIFSHFFLLIRIFFRLSQVNELTAFLTSKLPLRGELCSLRFYLCTKLIYA